MTIQEMADIAARHFTRMADAMIAACVACAYATGQALLVPERKAQGRASARLEDLTEAEWERMVRGNSDTRRLHM